MCIELEHFLICATGLNVSSEGWNELVVVRNTCTQTHKFNNRPEADVSSIDVVRKP